VPTIDFVIIVLPLEQEKLSDSMPKILKLLLILSIPADLFSQTYQTETDILNYRFMIGLNDTTDVIEGTATVTVKILKPVRNIILNFRSVNDKHKGMEVMSVSGNVKGFDWEHSADLLTLKLPNEAGAGKVLTFTVTYSGIPADGLIISKNKFGQRTFFADHWPDRASFYLPVKDHPSDKATVSFDITAPSHYRVVASGMEEGRVNIGGAMTRTSWKETVPLPVKVMAFGAADFSVDTSAVFYGKQVTSWVYSQNEKEGFSDYSLAVKPLKFYSEYIGEYPFSKLANVQSKTIFGGLENAGCIFYSENSVTGQGRAEGLIAHEIAHQWFGNSVTEADWQHIWLSEGFATYLTAMYLEQAYGAEKLKETMVQARNRVIQFSKRRISAVIDTGAGNPMELLNANSYQKGAWVLHMLRNKTGDDIFRQGLRNYYKEFRDSIATTGDFRRIMEGVSGMNLGAFFRQWLETPGLPEIKITGSQNAAGNGIITVEQTGKNYFSFPLELKVTDISGERILTLEINERLTVVSSGGSGIPTVTPDPDVKLLFVTAVN
jgi:aminopeptidase N